MNIYQTVVCMYGCLSIESFPNELLIICTYVYEKLEP